jgi:RNA polymerase sigma-70 factor (sigma-E family)
MSSETVELGVAIREDETSRLERWYALHAPHAGRLAYLLTGDRDLAEDLVQEAFVGLMSRFRFIREEAAIAAYLRRSVVNLVRKHWRRLGSERGYLRREGLAAAGEAAPPPDLGARDELWVALGKLSHRQRAALVLRFYEDLSEREAARILGCAVGTVKSSVARGLRRMREELIRDDDLRT